MDKLYSDFIDVAADFEERGEDFSEVSEWLYDRMCEIIIWANTDDSTVLDELNADYAKLKEMLEC